MTAMACSDSLKTWRPRCASSWRLVVNQSELIGLLREGIDTQGGDWADLGAGEGAFTLALAELLGPGAHITAVDRDAGALRRLAAGVGKTFPSTSLEAVVADF